MFVLKDLSNGFRLWTVCFLALFIFSTIANSPVSADTDELAIWGLPDDVGREEVEIYCSACHSLRLVGQQGLSRYDWAELFVWMVEEQEMEKMPSDDSKLVLDANGNRVLLLWPSGMEFR